MGREEEENSVLFALTELRRLESQRMADEAALAARHRAEEAEREAAERRASADRAAVEARRTAEEEARRRAESARERDADAARRIEMLKRELAAMTAERERLRERYLELGAGTSGDASAKSRTSRRGWIALLGFTTVSMAGLAIFLATRPALPPAPEPPVIEAPPPAAQDAVPVVEPAISPRVTAPSPDVAPTMPAAHARPHRPRPGTKVGPIPAPPAKGPPELLGECEHSDDLLCGMNDADSSRDRGRGRGRRAH